MHADEGYMSAAIVSATPMPLLVSVEGPASQASRRLLPSHRTLVSTTSFWMGSCPAVCDNEMLGVSWLSSSPSPSPLPSPSTRGVALSDGILRQPYGVRHILPDGLSHWLPISASSDSAAQQPCFLLPRQRSSASAIFTCAPLFLTRLRVPECAAGRGRIASRAQTAQRTVQ